MVLIILVMNKFTIMYQSLGPMYQSLGPRLFPLSYVGHWVRGVGIYYMIYILWGWNTAQVSFTLAISLAQKSIFSLFQIGFWNILAENPRGPGNHKTRLLSPLSSIMNFERFQILNETLPKFSKFRKIFTLDAEVIFILIINDWTVFGAAEFDNFDHLVD